MAAPMIETSTLYVRASWVMTGRVVLSPWKVRSTTVRSGPDSGAPSGNSSSASSKPEVARSSATVPDATTCPFDGVSVGWREGRGWQPLADGPDRAQGFSVSRAFDTHDEHRA